MVVRRGEVWWADLGEPTGAAPGFRRPIVVVQADAFNQSRIATVIGIILTSTIRLLDAPGNVLVPAKVSGLPKDSVANVSQFVTVDRDVLVERAGKLPKRVVEQIDDGIRLVLHLA